MSAQLDFSPFLPDSVRRAGKLADDLMREQQEKQNPPLIEGQVEEPGSQPGITETAANQDEPQLDLQAPQIQDAPGQDDGWRQRYLSLQGKYNSEVPTLTGQLRVLEGQVGQLQNLLAQVRQPPPQSYQPAPARAAPREVPKEDVEAYGEDLVTAARRWARAEIEPEISNLRQEITQLSSRSQQTATTLAQRTVEQTLDAEVPGWAATNNDTKFLAWLGQPDPFSGRQRHDMLTEAYSSGDGRRTAAFFRAFQTEQTTINQQPSRNPLHTGAPAVAPYGGGSTDRVSLEDLAAPGRGNMAGGSGAPERRIWSSDQIAAFYRDKQRGKYSGREVEAARLEADFFAAQNEGRIR